ncbi:MAG: GNAT family N-acetyltransferase [Myxococcales bacterium]|nr:GNAT family N-acetyltransferase [Myxococcales bacterium]
MNREASPSGYLIRPSRTSDLAQLGAIERAAAHLFAGMSFAEAGVLEDVTELEDFEEAHADENLWVASTPGGTPVGFAFVEEIGGCAHLDELDVHPDHGRRGVGAALVRAVCTAARERGFPGVTLTTFRDVAWNAPFYEKLGFRALAAEELSPELAALVRSEALRGLAPERRVVMRWTPQAP